MSKFLREPPSIRMAASVIVIATAVVVVGGGVLIRVLDHSEYSNIWVGMWWSIQTVTTVGYGDVTPRHASGRLVGVIVMLEGISFLAIITAVITSSLSVLPAALVFVAAFYSPGGSVNTFAQHLVNHLNLTGSTATLVEGTFGTASSNALAASVTVIVSFLLWGIGIGQLYQDVYAR